MPDKCCCHGSCSGCEGTWHQGVRGRAQHSPEPPARREREHPSALQPVLGSHSAHFRDGHQPTLPKSLLTASTLPGVCSCTKSPVGVESREGWDYREQLVCNHILLPSVPELPTCDTPEQSGCLNIPSTHPGTPALSTTWVSFHPQRLQHPITHSRD